MSTLALLVLRLLGWAGVLAIGIVSLVPGELRPPTALPASQLDHFASYGLVAIPLALGYPKHAWRICAMLCLYGALLELGQLAVAGRMARVIDVAANSMGACLGAATANALRALTTVAQERSASWKPGS